MKEISINCAGLTCEGDLYSLLAKSLSFTDLSDRNPDALYDCLTAISQETHVTIFGLDELTFGQDIRSTLENAEADNFWLNISIQ